MAVLTQEEIRLEEESPAELQSPYFLYKRHCDMYGLFENWVREAFLEKLEPFLRDRSPDLPFRIWSIGSGHGEFDVNLLKLINMKWPKLRIHFTVVEPHEDSVKHFKANISKENEEARKQGEFCWFKLPYRDFVEKYANFEKESLVAEQSLGLASGSQYDLVILVNALSHIGPFQECIFEILKLVSPGGFLVTVGATKLSTAAQFAELAHPDWKEAGIEPELYAETIMEFLQEKKLSHELQRYSTHFTTPCVFEEASVYGNRILDILTFEDTFRESVSADVLKSVMEKLKEVTKKKVVNGIEVDYFQEEYGFITTRK